MDTILLEEELLKPEEMTSDDEWVEVEQHAEWVFVNLLGNEEDRVDVLLVSTANADAVAPYQGAHKEEPDVNGDGDGDQRTQNKRGTRDERDILEGMLCHVADNGAHGFPERVSDYESAHRFYQVAGRCEDHDRGAYALSYEAVFSEGSCDDDDGEITHAFCEDACGEEDREEDDDDDDYDDEEETDDYSDALHEEALQDEASKHAHYLMDAMKRHYTHPVGECWQEYICSVKTETRRELHETKMAIFRGYGPQPRPFIKGSTCFNPHFEGMWLPWAINAEYCHDEDTGLLVSDGATGMTQCTLAAEEYMSSAVPILPVLEYMVNRAPSKKIAHIGSCSSLYWAALLQQLGAANVIVTEGSYAVTHTPPKGYPHIEQIAEEMFSMLNMAVGQALFFLRPSKGSRDAGPCMAERFLFWFPGDTIFFVGECGKHADNFDMAQWVEEHALEGWRVEEKMELPCWPGSHDVFLCITKASVPIDITT